MREIERCPICNEAGRDVVFPGTLKATDGAVERLDPYAHHYQINRCAGCGLLYSSPILPDSEISALYAQAPHTNVTAGEEGNVRATMRGYYDLARPHVAKRERILDVGCDIGLMLDFAREDGFQELFGIEPNPVARRVAEAVPGAVISGVFYEEQAFPEQSFDLITFVHVIDHLIDPSKVLDRAWRHVRPGGCVMAIVHNSESLLARVLGERFPPYNLYHHYFFSKRTLAELFRARGFEVMTVASTRNRYSIGFFTRRAPGIPDGVRRAAATALDGIGMGRIPVTLPVGNIGIVARRPSEH